MKQIASQRYLLWIVTTGLFMQLLDSTIVNTALPAIATSLNVSSMDLHLVITAYSLTLAMLTPAASWLADRLGTKRIYFTAIVLFVIGSILCARADNVPQLVASRIVQGVGGSMLMPVGRLALLRAFPKDRYISAITVVSIAGQVAPMIGPTLGGWIAEVTSWHWIFLINVPIGLVGAGAILLTMPDSRPESAPHRFDLTGFSLLATAMGAFFLGLETPLIDVTRAVWFVSLCLYAAFATILYLVHSRSGKVVLFPLSVFEDRTFRIGLTGNLFSRIGSSAVPFLLPLVMQLHMGYSPFQAGLFLLPVAVMGVVVKPLVVPLVRYTGYRRFLMINTVLLGTSIASFSAFTPGYPIATICVQLAVFGAVNSIQFAAMNSVTLKELDDRLLSTGNSLFSMTLMLSMATGVAVASMLVPWFTSLGNSPVTSFRLTFLIIGSFTLFAAVIFQRLSFDRVRVTPDADVLTTEAATHTPTASR